jgi:hypothetical protein
MLNNKQEYLSLIGLSSIINHLWVRPGAYPRVEYLKSASLGQAPAFAINIKLGLPGTYTLAL